VSPPLFDDQAAGVRAMLIFSSWTRTGRLTPAGSNAGRGKGQ
jgi:hypothetical protein